MDGPFNHAQRDKLEPSQEIQELVKSTKVYAEPQSVADQVPTYFQSLNSHVVSVDKDQHQA